MMSIMQLVAKCTPREWQVPLEVSPLPRRGSDQGLWIDPVAFIEILNGWVVSLLCVVGNRDKCQQFFDRPDMVGEASRHGRRPI